MTDEHEHTDAEASERASANSNRRDELIWRTVYDELLTSLRAWNGDGYRVGKITEDDKYGPFPRQWQEAQS